MSQVRSAQSNDRSRCHGNGPLNDGSKSQKHSNCFVHDSKSHNRTLRAELGGL